jgi:aconitate hydratase
MLDTSFANGRNIDVEAKSADGTVRTFKATVRIDTEGEIQYYKHGGILQFVLRQLA